MSCRRCCHRVAASVALALAAVLVFTAAPPSPARRAFTCAHRRQTGSPNFFPHGQEDGGGCSASGLCGRRPSALRSQLWGSEGCTVLLFPAFALNSPAHRVKTSNPAALCSPARRTTSASAARWNSPAAFLVAARVCSWRTPAPHRSCLIPNRSGLRSSHPDGAALSRSRPRKSRQLRDGRRRRSQGLQSLRLPARARPRIESARNTLA